MIKDKIYKTDYSELIGMYRVEFRLIHGELSNRE